RDLGGAGRVAAGRGQAGVGEQAGQPLLLGGDGRGGRVARLGHRRPAAAQLRRALRGPAGQGRPGRGEVVPVGRRRGVGGERVAGGVELPPAGAQVPLGGVRRRLCPPVRLPGGAHRGAGRGQVLLQRGQGRQVVA